MTVRELKNELSKVPEDTEVAIMVYSPGQGAGEFCPRSPMVTIHPEESWSPEGPDGKRKLLTSRTVVYL